MVESKDIEPAALYATHRIFQDSTLSLTQNVILDQGRSALEAVINKIRRLDEICKGPKRLKNCVLGPEIPQILTELCFHYGVASTILFNDARRRKSESQKTYKLRMERFQYVNRRCVKHSVSINVLSDRGIRNRMVHIDEYLAKELSKEEMVGWFIDTAIFSRKEFTSPDPIKMRFCRTYLMSEHTLIHLDREINLQLVVIEAATILAIVFGIQTDGIVHVNYVD